MEISYKRTEIQDRDEFGIRDRNKSYRFTLNGGKMRTTFNKIGNHFEYCGELCGSKKALSLYINEQLKYDLIELRNKILLYRTENLSQNVWQVFYSIRIILEALEDVKEGLHIKELYTKMPNNEKEEKYYLKESVVQNTLLDLEIVEEKNKKLVITELGEKVLKKNKEALTIIIRDREIKKGSKGKAELKGITNCVKCNQPLNNSRYSNSLLCFSCRRQEAIKENESD